MDIYRTLVGVEAIDKVDPTAAPIDAAQQATHFDAGINLIRAGRIYHDRNYSFWNMGVVRDGWKGRVKGHFLPRRSVICAAVNCARFIAGENNIWILRMTSQGPNRKFRLGRVQSPPSLPTVVASPETVFSSDSDAAWTSRISEDREDMWDRVNLLTQRLPGALTVAAPVEAGAPKSTGISVAS